MSPDERSLVSVSDGVLTCAIATAERGCSLSPAGITQATAAVRDLDDAVGAVLLVGEGTNFCTGGDVTAFAAASDPGTTVRELADSFHELVLALVRAPVPVVAAVQGWAAGAGLSLVCLADLVVCGESARLRPGYPAIGFSPDGGLTWTLPRLVGLAKARDLLLTDAMITAPEAARLGLVSRVVPDAELATAARELAVDLAQGPREALAAIKRLTWSAMGDNFADHLRLEAESIAACATSESSRERVAAFGQ